eukprot:11198243-Lingulodinium_polyedra.AAC.1
MDWELNNSESRQRANAVALCKWLAARGDGTLAAAVFRGLGATASAGPARGAPPSATQTREAGLRF